MTAADIDWALELCQVSGWNQVRADWEYFVANANCFVAVVNHRLAGTGAAVASQCELAWIAMMLVDPEVRRQAIGRRLLERALETCRQAQSVGLDATAAGAPLYLQYGFQPAGMIQRWRRDPGPTAPSTATATATARPAPFRRGHSLNQIGPLEADSLDGAGALVRAAIATEPERPWILDVPPSSDTAWSAWLGNNGFRPCTTLTRMFRGPVHPFAPSLWATAGPAFGPLPHPPDLFNM